MKSLKIILWVFVVCAGIVVLGSCGHVSAKQAPKIAQQALAKVGIAYQALAVAYKAAVEIRVQHCKATLGADATEADRVACMGSLGSDGSITTKMIRVSELYDDSADALGELAEIFGELEHELRSEGGQ